MTRQLLLMTGLLLAGCGKVGPLEPAAGHALPVKPLTARETPDAAKLLAYRPQAKPERIDELMTRSQPRKGDRFDLPPPDAGLAPASPTATTEAAAATTGPDNEDEPR